jgi:hypothetical protein
MIAGDEKIFLESLLAIVLLSFALGFWLRRKEGVAKKWPQSSGVIVTSRVEKQWVGSSFGQSRYEVFPIIEYEFSFEGRTYKTSHWRYGNFSIGNTESSQAILERYSVGLTITVFVNTRNPTKSVLETHPSSLCWVPFGFGILFLALFILSLFVFIMKHQS